MNSFSPSSATSPASNPSNPSRACQACNGAKVKCSLRAGSSNSADSACARCFRLKKECLPVPPKIRKRRSPTATATRNAKLEQRLEDLVSLLASKQQPAVPISPPNTIVQSERNNCSKDFSNLPSQLVSSASEVESLIGIYKTNLARNFPFVLVPDAMSARELQQRSPYLYESILMVATFNDVDRQAIMANAVLEALTKVIVIKGETNFDLLQAMLVYNAWIHTHTHVTRVSSTLHLTLALLSDLGLKSPQSREKKDVIFYVMNHGTKPKNSDEAHVHSSDEMRAYLGCLMLASIAAMCLKGPERLRNTPYVEDCCQFLFSRAEYPTDCFLAVTVRLQCIIDRILETFYADQISSKHSKTPIGIHVNFYRKELETFKSSLPLNIQQDSECFFLRSSNPQVRCSLEEAHFIMHYLNAEISLYESAIPKPFSTDYGACSLQQLDMLHGCLIACQQFFEAFFSMSQEYLVTLSFVNFGRLSFGIVTLFKLSLLDAPGWDLENVRQTVDMGVVLDRIIFEFEHAMNVAATRDEIDSSHDCFSKGARRLRRVREWWAINSPASARRQENQSLAMTIPSSDFGAIDTHNSFGFFEDLWSTDMVGSLMLDVEN